MTLLVSLLCQSSRTYLRLDREEDGGGHTEAKLNCVNVHCIFINCKILSFFKLKVNASKTRLKRKMDCDILDEFVGLVQS